MKQSILSALVGTLFFALFAIPSASACGGFFCSNFPIDQAGEKIVFSRDGDTVTATIQIQFTGDAEDFSWVLPLPTAPDNDDDAMQVGSEELFVQLLNRTNPTFTVEWEASECSPYMYSEESFSAPALADEAGEAGSAVEVLQVKDVGPYTTSVVQSDDPQALTAWLNENDYDQPETAEPLIAYYVEQNHVFLALKLKQNSNAGDIAPIIVKFDEPVGPCIPLVLTQIAAQADMPVYAWILGEKRVLPRNFFHVGINWAKVDWLSGGANYIDVVTNAVNEAAGHGFVTDYAGSSELMKEALYWDDRFSNIEGLAEITHPKDFYNSFTNSGLPSNSQTLAILQKYIPVPPDYEGDAMSFYNEVPWGQDEYLDSLVCAEETEEVEETEEEATPACFDPVAATAEIQAVIVQPIIDAQAMMDAHPYMTRLFTTVSPEEMNRDPIFVDAAELGDVSKDHVAKGVATCEVTADGTVAAQYELTLPDGSTVAYEGPFEPWGELPAAEAGTLDGDSIAELESANVIQLVSDDGTVEDIEPEMVAFNDAELAFANPAVPPAPGDAQPASEVPTDGTNTAQGCTQGSHGLPWAALLILAGLGSLAARRRFQV